MTERKTESNQGNKKESGEKRKIETDKKNITKEQMTERPREQNRTKTKEKKRKERRKREKQRERKTKRERRKQRQTNRKLGCHEKLHVFCGKLPNRLFALGSPLFSAVNCRIASFLS